MDKTNAERQRRWRERMKARLAKAERIAAGAEPKARIRQLEAELARERKRRVAVEAKLAQWKRRDKATK